MSTNNTVTSEQLQQWADMARECRAGWGRAFIADVYRAAKLLGAVDMDLASFKAAIAASPDCRSVLSRCDLVAGMSAATVSESEATYRTATYHLVSR